MLGEDILVLDKDTFGFSSPRLGLPLMSHSSPWLSLWRRIYGTQEGTDAARTLGEWKCPGAGASGELSPALETARSPTRKPPSALPGIQDLPATIIYIVQRSTIKQRAQIVGKLRPDANILLGGNVHTQPQRFVHVFIQQTFPEDLLCAH